MRKKCAQRIGSTKDRLLAKSFWIVFCEVSYFTDREREERQEVSLPFLMLRRPSNISRSSEKPLYRLSSFRPIRQHDIANFALETARGMPIHNIPICSVHQSLAVKKASDELFVKRSTSSITPEHVCEVARRIRPRLHRSGIMHDLRILPRIEIRLMNPSGRE